VEKEKGEEVRNSNYRLGGTHETISKTDRRRIRDEVRRELAGQSAR
jgi:hypothetical protein